MAARQNSRQVILDAAEAVVLDSGAAHLTLDAVAEKAKVSKGGLLYHFPSKEALLKGMISRCVTDFEDDNRQAGAQFADDSSRDVKAFISALFNETGTQKQVSASLLAAGANDPDLLKPVLEFNKALFGPHKGNKRRSTQSLSALLGATGLWFLETFQMSPLSPAQRKQVMKNLLEMADQSVE